MSLNLRLVAAAALIAVLIGVVWIAWPPADGDEGDTSAVAQSTKVTNDGCRECHASVWNEWAASSHAASWTSPQVQAAFRHFGHDRKCESCHAPEPVLITGLQSEVAFRADDRDSGVNCLSCHARADGESVAARDTIADAPCQPVTTPELLTSEHCGVCHTAIFDDWKASNYAIDGKSCRDCHMPVAADREQGRSHACPGRTDESLVRSGVKMQCRQENGELVVEVTNHATGHNFPGERHNRVLLIEVVQRRGDGQISLAQQHTIKHITPFRGESSAEEIRAGETHTARFPVTDPPVTATVRLLYKAFPWMADRDSLVVHEQQIELNPP